MLEMEQRHLAMAVERLERRVDNIDQRINRAILWLAIAASGVVVSIARTKLGL
jgi:hypothetical protein